MKRTFFTNFYFLVANIYGDPCTNLNSFNIMTRFNTTIELFSIVIDHFLGVDLNFVLHSYDTRSTSSKPRAQNKFATLVNTYNIFDIAALHSNSPTHTYFRHHHKHTTAKYDQPWLPTKSHG